MATATDHLEHVYVSTSPGVLNLAIYVLAGSPEEARNVSRRLCERAVKQSPALSGWSCV
ncbi:hypothetical protein [Kitasatospora sp. Ki12]|nr:hypothetical protein GCM10018790_47970 [Kitasatospora xanthocidica]